MKAPGLDARRRGNQVGMVNLKDTTAFVQFLQVVDHVDMTSVPVRGDLINSCEDGFLPVCPWFVMSSILSKRIVSVMMRYDLSSN